ncbi:dephospho-CoA kinase [Desulforamulus aeronauticus]|uniref:Dephospho-CoA kinase n=1 Tax=Desulforamulus aeronauticus DSM 10349 TaxID=1121421 RepID=A0A1M6P1Q3_9FIRM|nr:dephospho-CoA kinase [Desulforamulus aeronauticus]SHK01927.1 dephospho-CoA kinase [Desulforamulus aeronauticus DSM 10349]
MIIGLTGVIASGKSSVAKYLQELGATVIDADQVARQVVYPDTPALKEIVASFGSGILHPDGTLDRQKLGAMIFADAAARKRLDAIIHPHIEAALDEQVTAFKERNPSGSGLLVLEIPLLIEVGWQQKVDQVWLVTVDEEVQLKRLMERDKLTLSQAQQRIASQIPLQEKKKYSDIIIDNSYTPENTRLQVAKYWQQITSS